MSELGAMAVSATVGTGIGLIGKIVFDWLKGNKNREEKREASTPSSEDLLKPERFSVSKSMNGLYNKVQEGLTEMGQIKKELGELKTASEENRKALYRFDMNFELIKNCNERLEDGISKLVDRSTKTNTLLEQILQAFLQQRG